MAGIYDPQRVQEILWQYGSNLIHWQPSIPLHYRNTAICTRPSRYQMSFAICSSWDLTITIWEISYIPSIFSSIRTRGVQYPQPYSKIGMNITAGDKGIRTGEVYIIRAEALARRFLRTGQETERVAGIERHQ